MTEIQDLNKKAWYRLCKLCYGFVYVIALFVAAAIGYSDFPVEYVDSNKHIIRCANGKELPASAVLSLGNGGWEDVDKAIELCSPIKGFRSEAQEIVSGSPAWQMSLRNSAGQRTYTYEVTSPAGKKYKLKSEKELSDVEAYSAVIEHYYTFIPGKTVRGGYATLLWSLGIVVFAGEIIRRSFLYVVAGIPF